MMKVVVTVNKRQIEVQKVSADNEERVIRQLRQVYNQASKDCAAKIQELSMRTDMENLQTIIYQKQYQEALKKQIDGILNELNSNSFTTIADYLGKCYETGFIGTLYDLQGQGIPLCFPINQEEVVQALQVDSKISQGLYQRMGEDTDYLKKSIKAELSRGISNGSSWNVVAGKIASGMNSPFTKAYNRAIGIARTEGHRVQQESTLHCQQRAKSKGADVLKQWDSTLDGVTRPTHRELDGQIREVDEPFEVAGMKAMYPGAFGNPAEDCNCRCCLLQRARWALGKEELNVLKERAAFFGLDKTKDFEDYRQKYLKLPENADTMEIGKLPKPTGSSDLTFDSFFKTLNDRLKVDYNAVENHKQKMTNESIISALAGGDRTSGSCASVALAYVGQKQGWNVLDFRGGESQNFFSTSYNLMQLSKTDGIKTIKASGACSLTVGKNLLKQCEVGKEYYLCVGRHASIVRKLEDGKLQYLELQSAQKSGWTDFDGNVRYTLHNRFGCSSRSSGSSLMDFMIDIDDSDFDTDNFKSLLGYINTDDSQQRKGINGTIK